MKTSLSTAALALAASITLLSTTGATWPTMQVVPDATITAVLPDTNYSETPAAADKFVDSIGVDSAYINGYPSLVTRNLIASGIRHLRDSGTPTASYVAALKYLGQHGVRHSIGMGSGFATSDLRSRLNVFSPYIDFVEPANEADNVAHPNYAQMRSDQKNLWSTVRANKAWNNVLVAGPSFADPKDHGPIVGPLDSVEDFGNLHNSTCNWNPGTSIVYVSIDVNTARMRTTTKYKPIWTTENGFSDNLSRGCELTDAIIAKYLTRTSTERWLHGEPRTYFDSLTDTSNVEFGPLGLMHENGSPKPQFYALSSLVHLLADPGSAPKSTHVSYSISGATADVHHLLLARRDGSYDLLVYRELPCFDHYKNAPIAVGSENLALSIPGIKNAVLYKYNSGYTFSDAKLSIGSKATVKFAVTDSIEVLHFGF
jgi:hypothetical protein